MLTKKNIFFVRRLNFGYRGLQDLLGTFFRNTFFWGGRNEGSISQKNLKIYSQ